MGPGKPYWKMPVGFTGGMRSLRSGLGRAAGTGGGGDKGDGTPGGGDVGVGDSLRWERDARMAAVAAEPAAAETPAMIANVVFDILRDEFGNHKRKEEGQKNERNGYLHGSKQAAQHQFSQQNVSVDALKALRLDVEGNSCQPIIRFEH